MSAAGKTDRRKSVLTLHEGSLSITTGGEGRANGWAVLAFAESQAERDGEGFLNFEIPPSELREIADFINAVLAKVEPRS